MVENQLLFNLHSSIYAADDWIKGEINLKIEDEVYTPFLILKLQGMESVSRQSETPESIQSEILNYELKVHEFPNHTASIGDYVFPFEIYLPKDLPSSISIHSTQVQVSVSYTISAHLSDSLRSSSSITIQSRQDFPSSLNKSDTSIDIKSCFCFKKTSIDFIATAKKHAYTSNDIIKLTIEGLCPRMPKAQVNLTRMLMTNLNSQIKVEKTNFCEILTSGSNLDIDLKAFEDRLRIQTTSRGKFFACSYFLTVTGIPDALCHSECPELQLWIVVNPVAKAAMIPNINGPWRPSKMHGVRYTHNNTNLENY